MRLYIENSYKSAIEIEDYRKAGYCLEDFNVGSHEIRNIKIRYIFIS